LQTLIQADGKAVKIISQRVGNQTWQQKMPHVFFGYFPIGKSWFI
jgi:hypothetical protein